MTILWTLTGAVIFCIILVGIPAIIIWLKIRKIAKYTTKDNGLLHCEKLAEVDGQE